MATREWQTIKEYEEILFDYFEGIGRIQSTVRVIATHLLLQRRWSTVMRFVYVTKIRISMS